MISLTIFNKLRGVKQIHELLTYKRIYYIYKLFSLTKSQRKTFHIGYKLTKIQTDLIGYIWYKRIIKLHTRHTII